MEPVARKTISAGFKPKASSRTKHRIVILAFDGVVLGDLAIPLEIFGRVRNDDGQPCYDVRVCGVKRKVRSEHLTLQVPWKLSSASLADTVIVPGADDLKRAIPPAILSTLQNARDRGARIASICTGAFVLARAGVLGGLRATTHWRAAKNLRAAIRRLRSMPMFSMWITDRYLHQPAPRQVWTCASIWFDAIKVSPSPLRLREQP